MASERPSSLTVENQTQAQAQSQYINGVRLPSLSEAVPEYRYRPPSRRASDDNSPPQESLNTTPQDWTQSTRGSLSSNGSSAQSGSISWQQHQRGSLPIHSLLGRSQPVVLESEEDEACPQSAQITKRYSLPHPLRSQDPRRRSYPQTSLPGLYYGFMHVSYHDPSPGISDRSTPPAGISSSSSHANQPHSVLSQHAPSPFSFPPQHHASDRNSPRPRASSIQEIDPLQDLSKPHSAPSSASGHYIVGDAQAPYPHQISQPSSTGGAGYFPPINSYPWPPPPDHQTEGYASYSQGQLLPNSQPRHPSGSTQTHSNPMTVSPLSPSRHPHNMESSASSFGPSVSTQHIKRRRGNLPKTTTLILKTWLNQHLDHPYPTELEKDKLAAQTNLTLNQISNWFINARRRILPLSEGDPKRHSQ